MLLVIYYNNYYALELGLYKLKIVLCTTYSYRTVALLHRFDKYYGVHDDQIGENASHIVYRYVQWFVVCQCAHHCADFQDGF